ncbi:MAG: lytic transglycosylase domain-containing protein [Acidobacteria bacterium]|nr:lytic transglycosylase domain-containing protein [Acidobacteriota bacterium]
MKFCFNWVWAVLLAGALQAGSYGVQGHLVVRADANGRLVRSPAPAARPRAAAWPDRRLEEMVDQVAARHQLDPRLVHSVIRVESNYDPRAVSPKGALGLMQLIPATARRFGVADVFSPAENLEGGARYLKHLLDLYGGSYPLALAAYNAGEGAVARHRGIPPYPETRNYVHRVARGFRESPARLQAKTAENRPPEQANSILEIVEPDGSVRYVTR